MCRAAGAFVCFLLYNGFDAISKLPVFKAGADYYIEMLGINFHYRSISRGVGRGRAAVDSLTVLMGHLIPAGSRIGEKPNRFHHLRSIAKKK